MTIIYILSLLVSNVVTGFLVFKGVQLGLRWQIQVQDNKPPTMDNPVTQVVEKKQAGKEQAETENILNEWFNGAQEGR